MAAKYIEITIPGPRLEDHIKDAGPEGLSVQETLQAAYNLGFDPARLRAFLQDTPNITRIRKAEGQGANDRYIHKEAA